MSGPESLGTGSAPDAGGASEEVERAGPDDALFVVEGERVVPTPWARGPWDPNALHGSPVAALLARTVERHDPGPASFVARLTVDLLRPVPLAPLRVSVRTTRPGRSVQWLEAGLDADGVEVARAVALRIRPAEMPFDAYAPEVLRTPPGPDAPPTGPGFGRGWGRGYWAANDLRIVEGTVFAAGPGTGWFRLRCPIVAGEEPTPLQRVAAAADFGTGVGNPLRGAEVSGINADLTIHLHRAATGEWIGLESIGWASDGGVGMVETRLHDEVGPLGRAVQSMVLRRVPPPVPRS